MLASLKVLQTKDTLQAIVGRKLAQSTLLGRKHSILVLKEQN